MTGRLEGRVAFVTGAAHPQGRSHAVRLAREGANVIAFDDARTKPSLVAASTGLDGLGETARQVEALGRRVVVAWADPRDGDAFRSALGMAVSQLGRLDIVSTDAGVTHQAAPSGHLSDDLNQNPIDTDLSTAWQAVRAAIPYIRAGGRGGSIIFTSAAQHGVAGLVRTLAIDLEPDGIRVNSVRPTHVSPPMVGNRDVTAVIDLVGEDIPGQVRVPPDTVVEDLDISNTVAFLASDDARNLSGMTIPVDPGHLA